MHKRILIVFGTRPEAIKMAPLVIKLIEYDQEFETIVCVTAQHRHLLDEVLSIFNIIPDFDLDIMKQSQSLFDITTSVLTGIKSVIETTKPHIVLVHGDTTTSMTAALASFYFQIPVAHVEAGLRTYNIYSPWPEEINRQITSRISSFHFAPSVGAQKNLVSEGIAADRILVAGNTVIDALYMMLDKINSDKKTGKRIKDKLIGILSPKSLIDSWSSGERKLVLMTGHRRENIGEGFNNICNAVSTLASIYEDVDFVYPVHLNPNVRKTVFNILSGDQPNIHLIEPLGYMEFVYLMKLSYIVLTDSGGIQEEAPGLGKPVLVMRENTERPEAVQAGTVKLVGTDKRKIIESLKILIDDPKQYKKMSMAVNPYGDGKACERIIFYLTRELNSLYGE